LAKGSGARLNDEGVTTSMVYWADVLYADPDANIADYESTEERCRKPWTAVATRRFR
jgi:hypothetical protein